MTWTDEPPRIDGQLDDEVWRAAPAFGDFVERRPKLAEPPPVATTFRVLVDTEAIYFAIDCRDDQPAAILARTRKRDDFAVYEDDAITIKLDPALDRRTTFGFTVNPGDARLDYRGINESEFRVEVDALWQAATARHDDGWTAEIRIPWGQLDIDPANPPNAVGLNLSRDHPRRNATYDWSLLPPPFSPIAASRYGTLEGIATIARGGGDGPLVREFALLPYALGGFRRSGVAGQEALVDEALLNAGLDATAEIASFRGQLSLNTDFAQVDLDNQVVNLTRFGIFLPEKRNFFLSGLEVLSLGRSAVEQQLYTRRIGLDDDGPVPVLGGLKLVGRPHRRVRVGALEVITRPVRDRPWTSSSVARTLVEVGSGGNVGTMLTHRQALETSDDRNTVIGLDGAWRGDGVPLVVDAYAMGSLTGADAGEALQATGGDGRGAWADRLAPMASLGVSLRDVLLRPSARYSYLHPEHRSDLGFIQRVNVHQGSAAMTFEPRIGRAGIEKVATTTEVALTSAAEPAELLDWRATFSGFVRWDDGYEVGAIASRREDRVLQDLPVGRDTVIPAGSYDAYVVTLYGVVPETNIIGGSLFLTGRDFFGGELLEASADVSFRPTTLLRLSAGAIYDRVRFDALPDFDSVVVNSRLALGFTSTLGIDVFGAYNLLSDLVRVQSRLRWIYRPGSDLFLVTQLDADDDSGRARAVSIIAKSTYRWELYP